MAGHLRSSPSTTTTTIQIQEAGRAPTKRWKKGLDTVSKWLGTEEKGEWLKDMRGNLAMVATVIATITFQIGLNPPGGVVQNGDKGYVDCLTDRKEYYACPGESIYAAADKGSYFYFMLSNNVSFFSSHIVCLWLVSGLPLNHRFPTWLLSIGMCISLTSLAITYLLGAYMITPACDPNKENKAFELGNRGVTVWFVVVGIVGFFLVMRFVLLFVEIFTKGTTTNASKTPSDETDQVNRST